MTRWSDEFDRGDPVAEFRIAQPRRPSGGRRWDRDCADCSPGSCPCSEPERFDDPPGTPPDVKFLRWLAEQERKEAS